MSDRSPTHRRQGTLALVLIASAGGLAGCGPDPNDAPVQVSRAEYTRVEDCIQDWGSEAECEFDPSGMDQPGAAASANRGSSSGYAGSGGHHGGGVRWLGPWFSQSGTVYRYDGRIEPLRQLPTHASGLTGGTRSVNQIYTAPNGRYATTSAHPQANGAKTASGRGGFGGTGRLFASGGG
jgi:uncharacterized protein YgiB involved in biofilm formation